MGEMLTCVHFVVPEVILLRCRCLNLGNIQYLFFKVKSGGRSRLHLQNMNYAFFSSRTKRFLLRRALI